MYTYKALGQCRNFISTNIPGASTVKMPSTGAAAQVLLSPPNENRDPFKCAAICSRMFATIFNDLEILHEGIQDVEGESEYHTILELSSNCRIDFL
jgi:prephenate dehydratase